VVLPDYYGFVLLLFKSLLLLNISASAYSYKRLNVHTEVRFEQEVHGPKSPLS
jgi:hypothetical protein